MMRDSINLSWFPSSSVDSLALTGRNKCPYKERVWVSGGGAERTAPLNTTSFNSGTCGRFSGDPQLDSCCQWVQGSYDKPWIRKVPMPDRSFENWGIFWGDYEKMKRQNVRTLTLIICTLSYLLIGAGVFDSLESKLEKSQKNKLDYRKFLLMHKYNLTRLDFDQIEKLVLLLKPHKAGVQWKFAGSFISPSLW